MAAANAAASGSGGNTGASDVVFDSAQAVATLNTSGYTGMLVSMVFNVCFLIFVMC